MLFFLRVGIVATLLAGVLGFTGGMTVQAKPPAKPVKPAPPVATPKRTTPVGFPQDAGPHDEASIEWWYFYSFLTTEKGRRFAVVGSFFRTGLTPRNKGHYLLYSLTDLDKGRRVAYSVFDRKEVNLLRSLTQSVAISRPLDPKPLELLTYLQRGDVPLPHRALTENAVLRVKPYFSIAFEGNTLSQGTDDGRTWHATLVGEAEDDDWEMDLTLTQDATRPQMLVGGKGMTGVKRPDEMYYLTLSQMKTEGTLTLDGVVESFTGTGWLDRQWGSPSFLASYGWDWFGLQLDNGTEILLARIRDLKTGGPVKTEATILHPDGTQTVERPTAIRITGSYTDERTGIVFPSAYEITLAKSGYTLTITPTQPDQTIPTLGIGDAIWEGVVDVKAVKTEPQKPEGAPSDGTATTEIKGRGFMELVGYRARPKNGGGKPVPKPVTPAPATPVPAPEPGSPERKPETQPDNG